jgi:glycosyltransferase involved in cell wall biosynthesis
MADTTLAVSEAEKALLAEEVPGADVRVLSNIHQVTPTATPFEYRQDILFIGGFNHPPNTDAVIYFCRDMFPRIAEALPGVRFYVIGSDPPPEVSSLASKGVRILGYVRDVGPYWRECRLSVAPLRFGAGVKGKINESLAHGVPVVATSIAAEGMFLENGRSALIADGPDAFAEAVVRLYDDKSLWYRLSQGGIAVIEDRFSFAAARAAVTDLLGR